MGKIAMPVAFIQNCMGSVLLFQKFGKMVLSFDASETYFVPENFKTFLSLVQVVRLLGSKLGTMSAWSWF